MMLTSKDTFLVAKVLVSEEERGRESRPAQPFTPAYA